MTSDTDDLRNIVSGFAERVVPEDLGTTRHGAEHLARYLFAAHWAPGSNVADLCCGVGYGTNLLLAAGATRALGIDVSEPAIHEARQRFPDCEFAVADLAQQFDLTDSSVRVCFEAIEHVRDPHALLRTASANLSHDGVVITSTPNRKPTGIENPHHLHEYSLSEFRALLDEHFESVQLFFQWRYPYPLDSRLTIAAVLRAVVPVSVKQRLRRKPTAPESLSDSTLPAGTAARYRPLPITYLSVLPPGFRYGPPSIWIAVCSSARRS
jgi:SAM-dependent methyltransferase